MKIGEATFHVGDQVIARQQDRSLRPQGGDRNSFVRNGTRGVVVGIDAPQGSGPNLVVDFDRRGLITVPNEFLTKRLRPGVVGGLAPAYAMTTHAAQGDTYEASRGVITDRSSAAGTYVALSRGTHDLRLYAVAAGEFGPPSPAEEHNLPVSSDRRTLEDRIEARLARPQPTQLATQADPDLAKLKQYHGQSVRNLEQLEDPIAARAARIKLGQAQRRTLRELPDNLVAAIGDERDSTRWRTAVTRFAHYRERWGADPLESSPTKAAPTRQNDDHQRVTDAMADARAEQLGPLAPAEVAKRRRQLPARTEKAASDTKTAIELERRLQARRLIESQAVEEATLRHRAVSTPSQGRIDPDAVERQRRLLDRAQRDLRRTDAAIRDAQVLTGRSQPTAATANRVRIERRALHRIAEDHARQAVSNPQPYLTDLIGARPTKGEVEPVAVNG